MKEAVMELGPEAMLINTRPAPLEYRKTALYEVVFGVAPGEEQRSARAYRPGVQYRPEQPPVPEVHDQLASLRQQLEELQRIVRPANPAPERAHAGQASSVHRMYARLLESDFDRDLAWDIAEAAAPHIGRNEDEPALLAALRGELESRLRTATFRDGDTRPEILFFVGPAGSGKTSAIAKVAAWALASGVASVRIVSFAARTAGEDERLRAYAADAGLRFKTADSITALERLLGSATEELTLVDTQGYGACDLDSMRPLADLLQRLGNAESELVAPGTMRGPDLRRIVDRFQVFSPARLLITRADEATSYGPILSEAARTRKPMSFLSTGRRVPEDLAVAGLQHLLGLALSHELVDSVEQEFAVA
jgi:flagellar biosynthesis protein FlhF